MPRVARAAKGGYIYHVYNRGNGRLRIFNRPEDYDFFLALIKEGQSLLKMRVLGYCLMPTHWHLVLWPKADGELSKFVRWISNKHVRCWHQLHASSGGGHIYQGRFRSFPVQPDEHTTRLLRYIESNPGRAGVIKQSDQWPWSSLQMRLSYDPIRGIRIPLYAWPISSKQEWLDSVVANQSQEEVDSLDQCLKRGRPFGDPEWTKQTALDLNLRHTLRNPWRPIRREFA